MAEYSRLAKGHFTSTGAAQVINLPFQPDYVRFVNYSLAGTAATPQNIVSAMWDVSMGQGTAVIEGYNATPALIYDVVPVNGISTFAAGQLLQYGPSLIITAFTQDAATPSVTTSTNHGYSTGQWVTFQNLYQTSNTGMQQIAGIPFQITVTGATTFTINWNNSGGNYAAISSSSLSNQTVKRILYPSLYVPGTSFIAGITGSVVTTTAAHNFQVGQQVAFRIPTIWGPSQLNSLPDVLIPGQPKYYYVSAVTINTVTLVGLPTYTAFNPNQVFASYPGEQFPQIVAVGDVNSGGYPYTGGQLYPSPTVYNNSTALSTTINGPAIQGSYLNNTSQGFVIGSGPGTVLTTGSLVGASGNVVYWEAVLHDLSVN